MLLWRELPTAYDLLERNAQARTDGVGDVLHLLPRAAIPAEHAFDEVLDILTNDTLITG